MIEKLAWNMSSWKPLNISKLYLMYLKYPSPSYISMKDNLGEENLTSCLGIDSSFSMKSFFFFWRVLWANGLQAYLRDIVGLVPDHLNKANTAINRVMWLFWFPIAYKSFTYTVCILSHFSCVWLLGTLWTLPHQAALSMEFSRQEYWSGLPFSTPGDLPDPGIEPASLTSPVLAGRLFTTSST